jgi:hypothetical protein
MMALFTVLVLVGIAIVAPFFGADSRPGFERDPRYSRWFIAPEPRGLSVSGSRRAPVSSAGRATSSLPVLHRAA